MDWTLDDFFFNSDNFNNFMYISKEDIEKYKITNSEKEIINDELRNLYMDLKIILNSNFFSDKNRNVSGCDCWYCDNYILIHQSNVDMFIQKYIIDEISKKDKIRPSSLLIKILYRLHPEYFVNYDISKIKYINGLHITYHSQDSYFFIFDNYFKSENKECDNLEYYTCTICKNNLCEKHYIFNPFYSSKCKYCNNYWNICTWCKIHKLKIFFEKNSNELEYEKSICNIYH